MRYAGIVLALACVGSPMGRADVVFNLNTEFSGASAPSGTAPWLTATFSDTTGGVLLSLEGHLHGSTEFVNVWMFNLDPLLNPNNLGFTFQSGAPNTAVVSTGVNAFQADGDGRFDIQFDWPMNPMGSRFNGSDSVVYKITSSDPITEDSFDFVSQQGGGLGPFHTAAHVQGIGQDGSNSGWITVPEPATLLLFGLATPLLSRRKR